MTQPTTNKKRQKKIDDEIEKSVLPSPDSAHTIAERLNEHPTIVVRRLRKNFIWRGGRWIYRENEENENIEAL